MGGWQWGDEKVVWVVRIFFRLARARPRHRDGTDLALGPLDALELVVLAVRLNPRFRRRRFKVLERDDAKPAVTRRHSRRDALRPLLTLVLGYGGNSGESAGAAGGNLGSGNGDSNGGEGGGGGGEGDDDDDDGGV